jgi:hypothetical protein
MWMKSPLILADGWAHTGAHLLDPQKYENRLVDSLTPSSIVLPERLTGPQLVGKFSAFCVKRKFITAFTRACHLSLFWAISVQYTSSIQAVWSSIHPVYAFWCSTCDFSYMLPQQNLCIYFLQIRATGPGYFIHIPARNTNHEALHCAAFSPPLTLILGLLSTLFSNTVSLSSVLNVRDRVSHP